MPLVYTALITPFIDESRYIDFKSLDKLVKNQVDNNIDGIVLFGTTGESPTLHLSEKILIMDYVSKLELNDTKLIIGFSGNDTYKVIEEIMEFRKLKYNCNTYMLSTPYYNKPSHEGLYQHFVTILDRCSDINFILYNVPSRTGVNLLPDTIKRICNTCHNVYAVKEASGNLKQIEELIKLVPKLRVFSGDDGIYHQVMKLGGKGVISVLSNIYPKEMKEMNKDILDLVPYLFIETNPVPVKYLMCKKGLIESDLVRLPLVNLSKDSENKINSFLENFGDNLI